jgi:tetratricopeptide (TPR) repeat protein
MAGHSDSAVAILNQIAPEMNTASESVRRYYQLLRIEADDKTDKIDISPDSIKDLVHYYEEDGDEAMLPKAYYYAGRVYSDLNEAPISLSYFQKSLKAMEDNGTNDLHLQSVIYSQMGYLYLFQYIYDEAEQCFRASYEVGVQTNDTSSVIWGLRDLGITFQWQGKYNESLECLTKAEQIGINTNDIAIKAGILKDIASVLEDMGEHKKAKESMKIPIQHINMLDSANTYVLMSRIYYNIGKVDSFLYCAKHIERIGNIYAKEALYKNLTDFYIKQEKYDKVNDCFQKFICYNDSVSKTTKTSELQKVKSVYSLKKEEAKSAQLEKQKLVREFMLMIALVGLLALSTYMYSYRRKNLERFKRFRIILREIKLKNETTQKAERVYHESAQKNIKSSDIYRVISEKTKSDSLLNESDWTQAETIVNVNYPEFRERLFDLYNFSKHEYHICLLLKIGISPSQIAVLTAHSNSSITQTRKRLYKKCFGQDGTGEKWDEFIRSL